MAGQYPICATSVDAIDMSFNDIDEQACAMRGYQSTYHQISAGVYQGQSQVIALDHGVYVQFETFNQQLDQWGGIDKDNFVFLFLAETSPACSLLNQEFSCDDLMIGPPGQDYDIASHSYAKYCSLNFPVKYIEKFVRAYNPTLVDCFDGGLTTTLIRHSEVVAVLRNTVIQIQKLVTGSPSPDCLNSSVLSGLQTSLTAISAAVLSDEIAKANKLMAAPSKSMQLAFAARNLMRNCADAGLSVPDIAMKFGVSRRTLENEFRKNFNVSPSAYQRVIILNKLRSTLTKQTAEHRLIGDVAAEFGIWHLSRLAQQYKQQFHELPSDTIKSIE